MYYDKKDTQNMEQRWSSLLITLPHHSSFENTWTIIKLISIAAIVSGGTPTIKFDN
jgi:hypothetical protein